MKRPAMAVPLFLACLGCGVGLIDDLEGLPVCDGRATDPKCAQLGSDSSGEETGTVSATSGTYGEVVTTTEGLATLLDLTTVGETAESGATAGESTAAPVNEPPTV